MELTHFMQLVSWNPLKIENLRFSDVFRGIVRGSDMKWVKAGFYMNSRIWSDTLYHIYLISLL